MNESEKIYTYALRVLAKHPKSIKQLSVMLKRRCDAPEIIKASIERLKKEHILDDNYFAKEWASWRIEKAPRSKRLILEELEKKGIERSLGEQVLDELVPGENERDLLVCAAKNKFKNVRNVTREKAKEKVYQHLMRLGFSSDEVVSYLNSYSGAWE